MKFWKRNRDIAEEIESHLRMAEQDGIPRGEFGNELLIRETTRDVWGWIWLEEFARDLRYAFRQVRRAPGFAAVAILTLALGLGATTAMFSISMGSCWSRSASPILAVCISSATSLCRGPTLKAIFRSMRDISTNGARAANPASRSR